MKPHQEAEYEQFYCSRNVMEMLGILHQLGYGSLRLLAGLAPSGIYWRASIYTGTGDTAKIVRYSSSAGRQYFGWQDAAEDSSNILAEKFLTRFPDVIETARINACPNDTTYVEWYAGLLMHSQPLGVLRQYCDWEEDYSRGIPVVMYNAATIYVPQLPSA